MSTATEKVAPFYAKGAADLVVSSCIVAMFTLTLLRETGGDVKAAKEDILFVIASYLVGGDYDTVVFLVQVLDTLEALER